MLIKNLKKIQVDDMLRLQSIELTQRFSVLHYVSLALDFSCKLFGVGTMFHIVPSQCGFRTLFGLVGTAVRQIIIMHVLTKPTLPVRDNWSCLSWLSQES